MCIVYTEESFDTIFNMDYGWGRTAPLLMGYGSEKSPMDERVNRRNTCTTMQYKPKSLFKDPGATPVNLKLQILLGVAVPASIDVRVDAGDMVGAQK